MEVGFRHGALCDSYEKQANEQGFTLGDKAELFDKIGYAYNLLWIHGYLTDSQADMVCKKIQKNLVKSIKRIRSGRIDRMSISEQVKELREHADIWKRYTSGENTLVEMLYQSADTIESLSEKLQAANMERSDRHYTIEQIIDAIVQADDEIICAIQYGDREGLEDVLKDYLH